MTDERMDERLRLAGERWRAANQETAAVDLAAFTAQPSQAVPITPVATDQRRVRRVQVWLAASVGIAAAVAATVLVVRLNGDNSTPANRPATEGTSQITGIDWHLQRLIPAGQPAREAIGDVPFRIDGVQLSTSDGCNSIGGAVTITAGRMTFGNLATTEMACVDSRAGFNEQVAFLDRMLGGTASWRVANGVLTIDKPGVGSLSYVQHRPGGNPNLILGYTWLLNSYSIDNGQTASSTGVVAAATLLIKADGSLTGSTGCNELSGHATVGADGRLSNLQVESTRRACPDAATEQQESVILKVLGGGTPQWQVTNGILSISKPGTYGLVYAHDGRPPTK